MSGENLNDLAAETADLDEEAFLAEHPYPFLVRERTTGNVPIPGGGQRRTARLDRSALPAAGDGFMEGNVSYYRVFPRAEDAETVTIGREEGVDLLVADGSISARHAEFSLVFGEEDDDKAFYVCDLASANGTFVNGERLAPGTPRELSDMDSIRLGPVVKLQFFSAPGFFQFLSMYRRIKRPS